MKRKYLRDQFDILMVFTLVGIVPALFYYLIAHKEIFLGLTWNIFLGLLPFYFAIKANSSESKLVRKFNTFLWLLFLPNAPYILTDIVHVPITKGYEGFVLYLVAILSLTGLLSWMFSVSLMLRRLPGLLKRWKNVRTYSYLLLCLLSGIGVAMGRYARLNSWEIFYQPLEVMKSTFSMYSEIWPWLITFSITLILYSLSFIHLKNTYAKTI